MIFTFAAHVKSLLVCLLSFCFNVVVGGPEVKFYLASNRDVLAKPKSIKRFGLLEESFLYGIKINVIYTLLRHHHNNHHLTTMTLEFILSE